MDALKLEIALDLANPTGNREVAAYQKVPGVGWTLVGAKETYTAAGLESGLAGDLASNFPENEEPE